MDEKQMIPVKVWVAPMSIGGVLVTAEADGSVLTAMTITNREDLSSLLDTFAEELEVTLKKTTRIAVERAMS